MKIFFYKTLLVAFIFFIIFKITIGSTISNFERKAQSLLSKGNIEMIKEEIREEIKIAIGKDKFINQADADLINSLLKKIQTDLNNQK
jgi:hypothetical protein|tara:strand:- start:132 stop:395 length:264 start_codon:yes stop_codon:yes gene_type:complete